MRGREARVPDAGSEPALSTPSGIRSVPPTIGNMAQQDRRPGTGGETRRDPTLVRNIIADGCTKAQKLAHETMRDVRDAMGLTYT